MFAASIVLTVLAPDGARSGVQYAAKRSDNSGHRAPQVRPTRRAHKTWLYWRSARHGSIRDARHAG
jgi:hypothetical protein